MCRLDDHYLAHEIGYRSSFCLHPSRCNRSSRTHQLRAYSIRASAACTRSFCTTSSCKVAPHVASVKGIQYVAEQISVFLVKLEKKVLYSLSQCSNADPKLLPPLPHNLVFSNAAELL